MGAFRESLLSYDKFAGSVGFKVQGGSQTYRSSCGAVLSVCSLLLTFGFTAQMMLILFGYKGTTFTNSTRQEYLDTDYAYGADEGFMLAFGVVDSDAVTDSFGRPMEEYLSIKVTTVE